MLASRNISNELQIPSCSVQVRYPFASDDRMLTSSYQYQQLTLSTSCLQALDGRANSRCVDVDDQNLDAETEGEATPVLTFQIEDDSLRDLSSRRIQKSSYVNVIRDDSSMYPT